MKVKPLNSFVLVRPEVRARRYGSIIIGDHDLGIEKVCEGTGIIVNMPDELWPKSVEAKKPVQEPPFKIGDRVLYRAFLADAHIVEHDGEDASLIHFEDLMAVVDKSVDVGALSFKYEEKQEGNKSLA